MLLICTLRININGGCDFVIRDFWRPPSSLFWPPPLFINFQISRGNTEKFINISRLLMFCYCKQLRNILEIYQCSVKLIKCLRIMLFLSLFFYILPPPHLFWPPHIIIFQNPWGPPIYFDPPLFIMNLRVHQKVEAMASNPSSVGKAVD